MTGHNGECGSGTSIYWSMKPAKQIIILWYVLHLCDHYYLLCKIYLAFAVKIMHLVLTAQDAQSKSYIVCAKMK